jgi:hypothetical protein
MIISPDIMRRDTVQLLNDINTQIKEVKEEAQRKGFPPERMRDGNGNWVMSPLLLAKAQAYATLVQLQVMK